MKKLLLFAFITSAFAGNANHLAHEVMPEINKLEAAVVHDEQLQKEAVNSFLVGLLGGSAAGMLAFLALPDDAKGCAVFIPFVSLIPSLFKGIESNKAHNAACKVFDHVGSLKLTEYGIVSIHYITHNDPQNYSWVLNATAYIRFARALKLTSQQIFDKAVAHGRDDVKAIIVQLIHDENILLQNKLLHESIDATQARAARDREQANLAAAQTTQTIVDTIIGRPQQQNVYVIN